MEHTFTTATCAPIDGPDNGGITFNKPGVGSIDSRYPVGTEGSYYCNSGYIQTGARTAFCEFGGHWASNGTGPICIGILLSRLFKTHLVKSVKIDQ